MCSVCIENSMDWYQWKMMNSLAVGMYFITSQRERRGGQQSPCGNSRAPGKFSILLTLKADHAADAEKAVDKIWYPFMIKNSQKSKYRGNIP